MNFAQPTPASPQPGAAPAQTGDPAGSPAPHPAEAKVRALEQQLAASTKAAQLAETLDQRLSLLAETDPEAYRFIVQRLNGAPGVQSTPAPPQDRPQAHAQEDPADPGLTPQAGQPSALPPEVQQALAMLPQLMESQRMLQAEIAGLRERNLRSDVDTQEGRFRKEILDAGGTDADVDAAVAGARALIKGAPGLVKTPDVLYTLARASDYQAAQKRAVAKAQAEEQARLARISGYRGLPGGRSLTSEAGATRPKPKNAYEALQAAVGQLGNGTPHEA